MTRKRVGQGLHEAFSTTCDACQGRGYHISTEPVENRGGSAERRDGSSGKGKAGGKAGRGAKAEKAEKAEKVEKADKSPVAVEDPVEAPSGAPIATHGTDGTDGTDGQAAPDEDAPRPARRRRKAVSPVTTL
jgi:ribonuclease E